LTRAATVGLPRESRTSRADKPVSLVIETEY